MMRQFVLCGALVAMLLISGAYAAIKCYQCQPNSNNNYCSEPAAKGGYPSGSSQVSCSGYCLTANGNVKANGQPDQRFTIADCIQQEFADALGIGSGANQCKNGDDAKTFWQASSRFMATYSLPRGTLDTVNFCKCGQDLCNSGISITSTSISIAFALMTAMVVKMFY